MREKIDFGRSQVPWKFKIEENGKRDSFLLLLDTEDPYEARDIARDHSRSMSISNTARIIFAEDERPRRARSVNWIGYSDFLSVEPERVYFGDAN